ncbi:MAG: outer membrane protein assembly factor BamA [Syntrophobacteraceae bacterium]
MNPRFSSRLLYFALIPLLFAGFALASEGEQPQAPGNTAKHQLHVLSIRFEGNKIITSGELKKILDTKEKRFRWFTKAPLDVSTLAEDLERIQRYYLSQGFYHMQLVSHEIQPMVGNNVRVLIRVEEGPPMMVSGVDLKIDGPSPDKWRKGILKILPLKNGERFTTPGYKDIEKAALRYLADQGYPKAKLDMRARLNKGSDLAEVFVDITAGSVCTFGAVRIEGNESVQNHVILREVTFREGQSFAGSKIETTQQRLFSLDLFQFVDIAVEEMESEKTVLPIRILVKESKKQTVRVGAGYGTEDQVRGQVQYEIRNFFGDGRRVQVNAKASALRQLLEGRFTQPYFLGGKGSLLVDGGVLHEDEESFENRKIYIRPVYEFKWTEGLTTFLGYNFESNDLLDVDLAFAQRLANDREHQDYYVSSIIGGNTWERVDSALNPKKGWRILQNIEWASGFLGSEVDYIKLTLEGRGYLPTFKFGTLAAKLKWGTIEPLENTSVVPIFKRFFAGGSDSVRGYPYQRLGPLDSSGNPIGGMELLEGSLEWRFPIRNPFEGVIFFDFGNVAPEIDHFSWSDTRYTAGVGLRYMTIVGPLRFDVGYELNPPEQNVFSPYQLHFSIGQAF